MQRFLFVLVGLALPILGTSTTPVQKVLELLEGLVKKAKKEKHEEQVQFAAYEGWCTGTQKEKETAIADADKQIEQLSADIQEYDASVAKLTEEITELEANTQDWTAQLEEAIKVREIEKADYLKTHTDYTESVDALNAAINVLKSQGYSLTQKKALSKVQSLKQNQNLWSKIPDASKKIIDTFLEQDPDMEANQNMVDANTPVYEPKSGEIITMLEKLKDKFGDEKATLEREEVAAVAAHDMLVQNLKGQLKTAAEAIESKTSARAKAKSDSAQANTDLTETTAVREEDAKYLKDVTEICEKKKSAFDDRQKMRADEIEALEKAIEILSSDAVKGNAEKHLPTMLQAKSGKGTSLIQVRSTSVPGNQLYVAAFLNDQATKLGSRILATLAMKVQADPFAKVKKLIEELIARLMTEANNEAEHKGWCDKEMGTNAHTRKEKSAAVETLTAQIDELKADMAKLTEEVAELTSSVAELDAAVAKATVFRKEEKTKNAETVKDAKEAQTAVKEALKVLKEFYAKAAEATSLTQQKRKRQDPAPEIFDEPYKGAQAESGGVVGMLEVILSDFERLEAETTMSETQALKEYDEFMGDSAVDKAEKTKELTHKHTKKEGEEAALSEAKDSLMETQKQLDAALEEYDELKKACIAEPMSYEERVALRKQEIESLKEALNILEQQGPQ